MAEMIGDIIMGGKQLPLSKAVRANGFIFASGQLPLGADGALVGGDIETQARAALDCLKAVLTQAGAELTDVVKVTVWITDRKDFAGFNKIYAEYFSDWRPARSTVISDLVVDAKIEIEAVAVDKAS